jgi:hypothetical protein
MLLYRSWSSRPAPGTNRRSASGSSFGIHLAATAGFESTNSSTWLTAPSRLWSLGPTVLLIVFDAGRRRALTEQALGQ